MRGAAAQLGAFGAATTRGGRGVRGLAGATAAAAPGLVSLGAGARAGAAATRDAELAALGAARGMRGAGASASAAGGHMAAAGVTGATGFRRISDGASGAARKIAGLGTLLAGGALIYGLHEVVEQGNEYSRALLKYQEVTRASGAQMAAAGREAQALGSDLRLPAATSAQAADAMVELSKAGLSAQDAVTAARGTLQLAAAARTDIAQAAKIEGDIMDQFAMKASESTRVADVLANTTNNASGELIDLYYAMKYVGPTAHSMGVGIEDAATAVGLLGKSGIIGETAGTTLRGMLVNMAKQTPQMRKGLHELGIEAFDSQGKFRGLQYVIGKLHDAQERLTDEQFTSAAAMAFGKPALSGATALAHQGAEAFGLLATQVRRSGGAADIAAAESKGLGGAMHGLAQQVRAAFLQMYLGIAPGLERITRGMASSVSGAIPYIKRGIRTASDLWDIYGPSVERKVSAAGGRIGAAASRLGAPVKAAIVGGLVAAVPVVVTGLGQVEHVMAQASGAAGPLVDGLDAVFHTVASGSGALGVLSGRIQSGMSLLGDASGVLGPIGSLVGDLAHEFSALPGPIQLSVLAMLAMRPFRSQIDGMRASVSAYGRSALSTFGRVRAEVGRLGVSRALQAHVSVVNDAAYAYRNTSTAVTAAGGRLAGFRGAVSATSVVLTRGLTAGIKGLYGALGGAWGLAISGAMVGLDWLAKRQQAAAQAAAEHRERIQSLTAALRESNGATTESVREQAAQAIQTQKVAGTSATLADILKDSGVSLRSATDAYLEGGKAVDELADRLEHLGTAAWLSGDPLKAAAYQEAAKQLRDMAGEADEAADAAKALGEASRKSGGAAGEAASPTSRLQAAIKTLGDSTADADTKARALHQALTLLSGGELDVQAATLRMNQSLADLKESWEHVDKSKGFGKDIKDLQTSLILADGSLNTTTANGRTLFNQLQSLNEQTAGAAQATYDYARANGEGVVPALEKAEASMEGSWKAAVQAGRAFGLSAKDAELLAMKMGFIPSSLAITLDTKGLSQAQKELLFVQGLAEHMPKGSTITVSALTEEAQKALEKIGIKIHTLPGGRQMEITAPTAKAQKALDELIAKRLPGKSVDVEAKTRSAVSQLEELRRRIAGTKGKTVEITAPTAEARQELERLGFKISSTHGKTVTITLPTGGQHAALDSLQGRIDSMHGKTVTVRVVGEAIGAGAALLAAGGFADGGVVHASNGLLVPGYAPRQDTVPAMLSPGEGVLVPETVRRLAERYGMSEAAVIKQLNAWGRYGSKMGAPVGFADGGMVGPQRFAGGGLSGFTYTPTPGAVLGGTGDAKTRVDRLVADLRDAWKDYDDAQKELAELKTKKHTRAQLKRAEDKVARERQDIKDINRELGQSPMAKAPVHFNLHNWQAQLNNSLAATEKWRKNLARIEARGGEEVRQILEGMGEDGYNLVRELAGASDKQFNDIINKLKKTGAIAKATLEDFNKQIDKSNKVNSQFQEDLQKLASMGYGDLAQQLAAQGDQAAMDLAHQAVTGKPGDIAKANAGVQKGKQILTGEDLANSLIVLSALRSKPGATVADIIAAGVDYSTLRTLIPRMLGQIKKLPEQYKTAFLQQWAGQGGGMVAMAQGGILRSPTVLAGERGPESYIPLNGSPRSLGLLAQTAALMGRELAPIQGTATGAGSERTEVHKHITVHLHGAGQTTGEQAADVARQMAFIG
ncbi:phage tail tape measure protein [Streptomyces varsoviensis]|uniref:phage tail tape measure protein n=1 Tax=Streptomyces varsoviensis TaxID=67373 RepID=UPI0033E89D33